MKLVIRAIIFLSIITGSYFVLFLNPKIKTKKNIQQTTKNLSIHQTNLTQNRLSFVELTRLDPKSSTFNFDRTNLIGIIQKTNSDGIENLALHYESNNVDIKIEEQIPRLLKETKLIYEDQMILLDKVAQTDSFEEGREILLSEESIQLLTRQTNLILEYDYWIEKLTQSL